MSEKQNSEVNAADAKAPSLFGEEAEAQAKAEAKTKAEAAAAKPSIVVGGTNIDPLTGATGTALEGELQRRSIWYTTVQALKYVSGLSKDDDLRVRDSDRTTAILLLSGSLVSLIALAVPALMPLRLPLLCGCDILVGVIIVLYVAHRFGVINTMTPRQALLSWQLIVGGSFLGVFITLNLAIITFFLLVNGYFGVGH